MGHRVRYLLFCGAVIVVSNSGWVYPAAPGDANDRKPHQADRVDRYGDPLPAGAVARLGSIRFLHENWLRHVAFLPGDKHIVAACSEGVRLWDVPGGGARERFPEITSVMCAALSPDGETVAVAENGPRIFLYDPKTARELRRVGAEKGRAGVLAWSRDSRLIAAGFEQKAIVWEAKTGKVMHSLAGPTNCGGALAFSPDGKVLLTGAREGMELWDLATEQPLGKLQGGQGGYQSPVFAPDGKTLIGPCEEQISKASTRSSLRQWDAANGKAFRDLGFGSISCVTISPDGATVASGGTDIQLWDLKSGKELRKWPAESTTIAFSNDGKTLASGGWDRLVRLWDAATGKELREPPGHHHWVQAISFAPNGHVIASGGADATMRFWDPFAGRELRRCSDLGYDANHWGVFDLAYAPDGRTLVSGERHRLETVFQRWDAKAIKSLSRFRTGHVSELGFTPDGKSILSANWDGAISVWEPITGASVRKSGKHNNRLTAMSVSPDGRTVAWVGDYHVFGVRDLATGKDLFRRSNDDFRITHISTSATKIAFSPDGAVVATADNPVRLWDAANGKLLAQWIKMRSGEVAFSPDGRLLAAAIKRGVALWEIASRQEIGRFTGHLGEVKKVAFAPDGRVLASAGADGTILVWDVTGMLQSGKLPRLTLKAEEIQTHWNALVGSDAKGAQAAIWSLAAAAPQSLSLVEKHLRTPPATKDLERLVHDLGSDLFATRTKAMKELSELGQHVQVPLRRALKAGETLEFRRRVELLLAALDDPSVAIKRLHRQRAFAVLEYAGTKEARELLEKLAKSTPDARVTLDARAVLDRLAKRSKVQGD